MTSMLPTLNEGFSTGSLSGAYAVTCISQGGYGASGALGVYHFDGAGHVSGSVTINGVGTEFGQRRIITAKIDGTYVIDDNGSGYGSTRAMVTIEDGFRREVTSTVLITRAADVAGRMVAQELCLMEDGVEPATGGLNMVQAVRHPEDGVFSLASFRGTYGGPGIGHGAITPASAIGIGAVNFRGDGTFTAVDIQNLPGTGFAERRNATFDTEDGRYTVNADGTGMIIAPGGQAHLVITRTRVVDGIRVCDEYFFLTNDGHPPTGNLITTRVSKRLP